MGVDAKASAVLITMVVGFFAGKPSWLHRPRTPRQACKYSRRESPFSPNKSRLQQNAPIPETHRLTCFIGAFGGPIGMAGGAAVGGVLGAIEGAVEGGPGTKTRRQRYEDQVHKRWDKHSEAGPEAPKATLP